VRSERLLMEELNYNLLFCWFAGLNVDDAVWDVTVFTKNRQRPLDGKIAEAFFGAVLGQAEKQNPLSDEHFTVDGTLLEAWANRRSFREKQDPPGSGTGSGGRLRLLEQHGPGVPAVQAERRRRSPAQLFRARGDGKSQWVDRAALRDRVRNARRTHGGLGDAAGTGEAHAPQEKKAGAREDHRRRRQGVSGQDVNRRIAQARRGSPPH
jgi:Transposase domain (DUF772)